MTPPEAQAARDTHAPCTFYSLEDFSWGKANTFYRVEVIRVKAVPVNPRIVVQSTEIPGFEIDINGANFPMLQLTSHMEETFIEVVYDARFSGGSSAGDGDIAFVPAQLTAEIGLNMAFQRTTAIDPQHIMHWSDVTIDRCEIWMRGYTNF